MSGERDAEQAGFGVMLLALGMYLVAAGILGWVDGRKARRVQAEAIARKVAASIR